MPTCIGKLISFFGANNLKAVEGVCMKKEENSNNNDDFIKKAKNKKMKKITCDIQAQENNHKQP